MEFGDNLGNENGLFRRPEIGEWGTFKNIKTRAKGKTLGKLAATRQYETPLVTGKSLGFIPQVLESHLVIEEGSNYQRKI